MKVHIPSSQLCSKLEPIRWRILGADASCEKFLFVVLNRFTGISGSAQEPEPADRRWRMAPLLRSEAGTLVTALSPRNCRTWWRASVFQSQWWSSISETFTTEALNPGTFSSLRTEVAALVRTWVKGPNTIQLPHAPSLAETAAGVETMPVHKDKTRYKKKIVLCLALVGHRTLVTPAGWTAVGWVIVRD